MQLSSRASEASRGICGSMLTRWSRLLPLALIGLFLAAPIHAAELANLRNGFSLRHDHHEVVGATTRLYMSADAAGRIH